ncbi:deoxyribonuclease-1-like isoform 2-T2 [Pholidichthys leucotaenia]
MRWHSSCILLLLLFSFFTLLVGKKPKEFKICSYNVQNFNKEKASNHRVLNTLIRVLSLCDICLLQNVVDPRGEAIKTVVEALNRFWGNKYTSVSSKGLGKSNDDMQQYVFIYNLKTVKLMDQYQHSKRSFVRPPFVVHFQCNKTAVKDFILVPLHSDPSNTVKEIDWLYDVFDEAQTKWKNKNVMLLGDFHASCAYMTRSNKKKIRLFKDKNFSWLIGDKVDTTVTDETSCAYDRIVVHGETLLRAVKPFSARVTKMLSEMKMSRSKVLALSDHFPIEVTIKSSASYILQATPLLLLLGAAVIFEDLLSDL